MSKKQSNYPFISVCTPTFNRRPFIPTMFECFRNQNYPKSRIEWIIVDDGTDKIKDLVDAADIPQIKYIALPEKINLGAKRNICHSHCKGSIIVYMDDDDYYPPERISHAVEMLNTNKQAMIAGSSTIYVYFKDLKKMVQFGPYNPNHATAATFAFRKELLNTCKYEDHAALAEERHFLKNWSIPMVQLDPLKTILVFSHKHNTFDKKTLLDSPNMSSTMKTSDKTVKMFIRNPVEDKIRNFFMNEIDVMLKNYKPGEPSMKPDVLIQIKQIDEQRKKEQQELLKQQNNSNVIMMQEPGKEPVAITLSDAVGIINRLNEEGKKYMEHAKHAEKVIQDLQKKIINLETQRVDTEAIKKVAFSENLIQPSHTVQEQLKQKDKTISELELTISQLKKDNEQMKNIITKYENNPQSITTKTTPVIDMNSSNKPIYEGLDVKSKLEPLFVLPK